MGLLVALFCSILISGITAQDTRKVTKDGDTLVFEDFQPYCTYGATEVLEQPPESAAFGNIAAGIIGVVAPGTVQSLVEAIDVDKIQNNPEAYLNENWQGFTFAFVAIPILFLIGVILAFCVPCIGLCFCCCRCCDACGGKMMQKDEHNTLCRRAIFALTLLVTAIILGVGCASVYLGGKTSISTVERSVEVIDTANSDLRCYTNSIFQELAFLVNLTGDAIQVGLDEGGDVSNVAGEVLSDVEDVYSGVKELDQNARALSESLMTISKLQDLSVDMSTWLDDYEATLTSSNCRMVPACNSAGNTFDRNDFEVPSTSTDISTQLNNLTSVLEQNLTASADNLLKEIEPLLITFDAGDGAFTIPGFNMSQLTSLTGGQVDEVDSLFDEVSNFLNDPAFEGVYRDVTDNGFIGIAIFAGLVGVIAILYVLGIIFGEIGRKRDDHPLERDCMANCGGCLLVIGWVFSFLFYFIIAILAAFYFLGGSIGEIFICQPLSETSSFDQIKDLAIQVIEASGGNTSAELDALRKFNFANALASCEANGGLYDALNLDDVIGEDIDQVVNDLRQNLDLETLIPDINVTVTLDFDGLQHLDDLAALNFTAVNFNTLEAELDGSIPDLTTEVTELRELAANVPEGALKDELNSHATKLEEIINTNQVDALEMDLDELKAALPTLEADANALVNDATELSTEVQAVSARAEELQEAVDDVIPDLPKLQGYVNQTVDHIVDQIKTEVGKCRPLYNLFRGVDYIVCDNLVNSLNAIWLGLGIAVVFFIVGIIFAVKLSKFYRRMLYDDESHHGGYNGHSGQAGYGGHEGYPTYDKNNYPV